MREREEKFCNFHSTVWKNEKFAVTHEKFRQINSLVFSLVKTVVSRNFCQRSETVNFRNFHTVIKSEWANSRNGCSRFESTRLLLLVGSVCGLRFAVS